MQCLLVFCEQIVSLHAHQVRGLLLNSDILAVCLLRKLLCFFDSAYQVRGLLLKHDGCSFSPFGWSALLL